MRNIHFILALTASLFVTATPPAMAGDCPTPKTLPACSYVATNGRCSISIDRMNPVTPPTIYVKRGCPVTVEVTHSTALEDLTLDWKSSTTVVPPDTFQSGFSSLTTNLGKLTLIGATTPAPGGRLLWFKPTLSCEAGGNPKCNDDADEISRGQNEVLKKIEKIEPLAQAEAKDALQRFKLALQPPPGGVTSDKQPWYQTEAWGSSIVDQLQKATSKSDYNAKFLIAVQIKNLADELVEFKAKPASQKRFVESSFLDQNQATLKTVFDSLSTNAAKLDALVLVIKGLPAQGAGLPENSVITDTGAPDKNYYQAQTWNVNYTNKLLPAAKRVAADGLKSDNAALLSGLADPPAKQSLVTIAVQFQSPSRFEVSSGLMVPVTPYHSYVVAPVASKGMITDNVVQENKTYTVVPMAFVNYRLTESTVARQNSAFFVTGGVGYNPATSTVEFGTGLTFSYRSIAISGLADIGRDTRLIGGFTVGESLGLNPPRNVPTATGWVVKPAFALSVRIPLGGSGK